jgi:methionyl-tRNA synthetase
MLYGVKQDYVLPWQVPANEFYNLEGDKFSTSRGWSIPLESFFERYDAEAARFYLLASSPETKDTQWLWEEFQQAVNGALADTIGNLATRVLRFVARHFEGRIPPLAAGREAELDRVLLGECGAFGDPAEAVRAFRFRRAAEQLVENGPVANVFVDRTAPWTLIKTDREGAASVLATCCDWLGWMALWMAPILPGKAQALWRMLGQGGEVSAQAWPGVPRPGNWRRLAHGTPLGAIEPLFAKIDDATIRAEIEALRARSRG